MEVPEAGPWRVCRTCMRQADDMSALYSDQPEPEGPRVADMISTCTGLQVDKSDGLPEQVCSPCVEALTSFFQFRCGAERSDALLRATLARRQFKLEQTDLKEEPQDLDLSMDYLDDCLEHHLKEFSDDDKPLIKFESSKSKENQRSALENVNLSDVKKYCCSTCGKLFDRGTRLRRHEKTHVDGKTRQKASPNMCEICFKSFKKPVHLRRHVMRVHDQVGRPYVCMRCPQRFQDQGKLLTHAVLHHGPLNGSDNVKVEDSIAEKAEMQRCELCSEMYQSRNALAAHMRKHRTPGRVLACAICSKVFKKTSHLKRHERSHEDNRPYKCGLCTKSFVLEEQLSEHQNKHKGVKPHVCPVCSKPFAQRCTLTAHLRVHTRERSYLCPACGKRFDSSNNLNQHMRRHNGVKAFACTYCPGRFVSKGELNSHMSTHTGARPHVCDACGSAFTKPSSLAKHKLLHEGVRPHECDVCSVRFANKEHLKRHRRIHTGEKPYRCNICERAFTQSNDLVKHRRSHLGDNLYKCEQCSDSFRLKTELRNHMSTHYIRAQVAAGIPISLPPPHIKRPRPGKHTPRSGATPRPIVVTQLSEDTVLTLNKMDWNSVNCTLRERIAEHVRTVPTAISVKRISCDHNYSESPK